MAQAEVVRAVALGEAMGLMLKGLSDKEVGALFAALCDLGSSSIAELADAIYELQADGRWQRADAA